MNFDIFENARSNVGTTCTREVFDHTIDGLGIRQQWDLIGKAIAENKPDLYDQRKRNLPAIAWQATFEGGKRKAALAHPNGLFMLDVDHISDLAAFIEQTIAPLVADDAAVAEQLGIVAIHVTPSRAGMRFVCKCPAGVTTIEGCQKWLAEQVGILSYDEVCKDFARLSFLAPRDAFLYLDEDELFDGKPRNILRPTPTRPTPNPSREGGEPSGLEPSPLRGTGEGVFHAQQRTFTEEQRTFTYRGHLISDIAARWVKAHGEPQQGERHTYYYRLCTMFRYITDGDVGVLLAQLPDFGMGASEREKEAEHACRRSMGTQIPYTFYKFLVKEGIINVEKQTEPITITLDDENPTVGVVPKWLPPVFREFCKNCPADFAYPSIVAILPVLGTLATRLRARYLDGREHSPSFISVIFAPQSAGKSFARDIVQTLTPDPHRHDENSVQKERLFKAELRQKKNSEHLPEDPHAPYRLVQAVISVPRLLQRQEDAGGLHQLSFVEEIDTLTKSNAGGSYAQKSDLYRQAFDNAEYGQDYISIDTFTGSVRLYYNILMLGTPKQLYKFFNDAENGLVTRCCFAELQNQEFASIPYFAPLTEKQQEEITKILNRFEAMTYRRKNAQSEDFVVLPEQNIDSQMQPIREALADWLEKSRVEALKAADVAADTFRRRAAVKAFRLGMVCVGMYERKNLKKATLQKIADFCTWFAEQDKQQALRAFGTMLNEQQAQKVDITSSHTNDVYSSLPEEFSAGDLQAALHKSGMHTPVKVVVYRWRKRGLIKVDDKGTFVKLKK